MKIQFDPNLNFQKQAIDSITKIFEGQEICQTNFTVEMETGTGKTGLYLSRWMTKRNSTSLFRPKAPYSPMHSDLPKKPRLHGVRSTSKLWVKRLSSLSPMSSRTFQGSMFNE
jgi:hypothetical protein